MLAQEMDLDIVEWINSVNENNLIRRAGLPDQKKWDSVDDGEPLGTLNDPMVLSTWRGCSLVAVTFRMAK